MGEGVELYGDIVISLVMISMMLVAFAQVLNSVTGGVLCGV